MDTSLLTALTFTYRGSLARKSPGSDLQIAARISPHAPLASKNNIRTYLPHTNTLCISRSVSPGCTHRDVTHKTQTRKRNSLFLPPSSLSLALGLAHKKEEKTKNTNNRAEFISFYISGCSPYSPSVQLVGSGPNVSLSILVVRRRRRHSFFFLIVSLEVSIFIYLPPSFGLCFKMTYPHTYTH